jgi:plasmid maintenance system antidote protein VapI
MLISPSMKKSEALALFGGTQRDLAEALQVTASRISQLPDELDQATTDRVIGAAIRLEKIRPVLPLPASSSQSAPSAP